MSDHLRHGSECACHEMPADELREQSMSAKTDACHLCGAPFAFGLEFFLEHGLHEMPFLCTACINEARWRIAHETSKRLKEALSG